MGRYKEKNQWKIPFISGDQILFLIFQAGQLMNDHSFSFSLQTFH